MVTYSSHHSLVATSWEKLAIYVHGIFWRCPCPTHARKLLSGTYCIKKIWIHEEIFLFILGQTLIIRQSHFQPERIRPVEWFSFIFQLIHHRNPTLSEGLCTPLAIQATCEDDQELLCLPEYLHLVYLVVCCPTLFQILYPTLQDISCVHVVVGCVE